MFRAITVSCYLASCFLVVSTTTTTPSHPNQQTTTTKPTREPNEHVAFRIIYEAHTHMMVVVKGSECYFFTMSDAERVAVHTDAGMRAIELKMLGAIGTDAVTVTSKDQIPPRALRVCGSHVKTFYKETVV